MAAGSITRGLLKRRPHSRKWYKALFTHGTSASRADGRKVQCPLLVLWGSKGRIGQWYDALAIWRDYCAAEVMGGPVESGHFIPEEAPEAVLDWFGRFFG